MEEKKLFWDSDNNWLTSSDLLKSLREIGADQCETLFIHTSLNFGIPNPQLKKKELLGALFYILRSLRVRNLLMPTFTFSFPNGKDYNPETSASRMGVLNEYFRKQEGVVRSNDPLMSVALLGEDKELVTGIGHSSCGANSTYDLLHKRDGVKFLFLGAKIGDCMTYMHYLEWLYSVDYRYERTFNGYVERDGDRKYEEYNLFVRYKSVLPNTASYIYEQRMYDKGTAKVIPFGNSTISIVGEKEACAEYARCLAENPYFFVDFFDDKFIKDKSFELEREMVAL